MRADKARSPLYAAGFTTAFGAHGVAGALGVETGSIGESLFTLGVLLAVYDLAEIVLKPIFGSVSDRIGVKPVIVGGLLVFAVASLLGVFATSPVLVGAVRLAQGAAASAFSPAASAAVGRLAENGAVGTYFGKYGSWKGLGYALGPLLGAGLLALGGFPALFLALAVLSAAAAAWVGLRVPHISVLPRTRPTVIDLVRQLGARSFLVPTSVLAATTASLGVAVGFLPLLGTAHHLGVFGSMALVTVLALISALAQPRIGRLRDAGRITTRTGIVVGLCAIAIGLLAVATLPGVVTLFVAAAVIGLGIGITTPLAFAHLAASTPAERLGRTMGSAELGRELGDAGGPLLVGALASTLSVSLGLAALAAICALTAVVCALYLRARQGQYQGDQAAAAGLLSPRPGARQRTQRGDA